MDCFITRTASHLPGLPIDNTSITDYLGTFEGDAEVREKVLRMNGITQRYYAQSKDQVPTDDVYGMGSKAVRSCLAGYETKRITYLGAGTTYAPYSAPGPAVFIHDRLSDILGHSLEVSSQSGVCSASAAGLVAAIRGIQAGDHEAAVCVGTEQPSEILKASAIQPVDDRNAHKNIRDSQWFMSVFLRYMLSDGAGAFLLQNTPELDRPAFRVNWTHSMSFAHRAPACMKLDNSTALLSQDLPVLMRHMMPCSEEFIEDALTTNQDDLDSYSVILPHMSSFFFRRGMERVIARKCDDSSKPVPYWTNLSTAGNTGCASIFIMLDEYLKTHQVERGNRILLFVPESGQFNFVMVSLTAVLS
ncbi:MAG: beta-ketoacyl synthase N-terminal-like domain-containing protein [Pontiella sp.]